MNLYFYEDTPFVNYLKLKEAVPQINTSNCQTIVGFFMF